MPSPLNRFPQPHNQNSLFTVSQNFQILYHIFAAFKLFVCLSIPLLDLSPTDVLLMPTFKCILIEYFSNGQENYSSLTF